NYVRQRLNIREQFRRGNARLIWLSRCMPTFYRVEHDFDMSSIWKAAGTSAAASLGERIARSRAWVEQSHFADAGAQLWIDGELRIRQRDRETRLGAIAHGLTAATELDLKEHDRLAVAPQMMKRKLRRTWSTPPELVPAAGLGWRVTKMLEVTSPLGAPSVTHSPPLISAMIRLIRATFSD
ncbi:hypothetical protein BMJ27_05670, partial [Sinorhizobium medicae]